MKKTAALLLLIMLLTLTSCGTKEYKTEEISLGKYSVGQAIKGEVGDKISLSLKGIPEKTMVEASMGDIPLAVTEEGLISLPLADVNSYDLCIKLTNKRYEPASLHWDVISSPHTLSLSFEEDEDSFTFVEGQQDFSLKAEVSREGAEISIEPEGMGEFILSEEQEEGVTKGTIKLLLPQKGETEYKISAAAEDSEVKTKIINVSITPKLKASLNLSELHLYPYQEGLIEVFPEAEDAIVTASVTKGDASLHQDGNSFTVTGGEYPSSIYIRAEKDGFAPYENIINVKIPLPPPRSYNNQTPNQVVSTKKCDHILDAIFEETNRRRAENGLPALERVKACDTPAMLRAKETDELWSHTRPDGRNCFSIHDDVGLKFDVMGENLFSSTEYLEADDVLDEWMASPGHKANILQPLFKGIGLGYYEGSKYTYWVQIFVG